MYCTPLPVPVPGVGTPTVEESLTMMVIFRKMKKAFSSLVLFAATNDTYPIIDYWYGITTFFILQHHQLHLN